MKQSVLLIVACFNFVQASVFNLTDQELDLLQKIGIDIEPKSEEFHTDLRSNSVPLVINPSETIEPPKFSVAIFRNGSLIGSGAIISQYFVLTVCSLLIPKANANIDLTDNTRIQYPYFASSDGDLEIHDRTARRLVPHPECGKYSNINPAANVGLIQTTDPMKESNSLKYPQFPTVYIPAEKGIFILSSFRVNNPIAINMEQAIWYVITKQVPNQVCKALFESDKQRFDLEANLCMAYVHVGGADHCKGDIGSLLTMRYNNQDILVGLNIHKHGCGEPKAVAAFVCVNSNKDWMESTMKNLS